MSLSRLLSALACFALLGPLAGPAAARVPSEALPDGATYVHSAEGIDEYRLENGLRVILFPDPSKQTTTVNITYLVGSAHEGYGEKGMAHLLEHLVFKGTPDHPEIDDELTSHGARANGTTWLDRTNYYETFAATDENLQWALDLEADRMLNSFISGEDLDSEMTVVRNEFEMGENYPEYVLEERVYSTAFLWHNYGNTTIGNRSDIERVPIDRLQAFYRTWYRPGNAILVVAGKFDEGQALSWITEKFAPLENPSTPTPSIYTQEPAQDGSREVVLRRVGDKHVVALAYHIPAGRHPDHPALQVLSFLLGDTPAGRLHQELVETQLATRVRATADRFNHPALMYLESQLRENGDADRARDEMIRIVEEFATDPPSPDEVERAKNNWLRNWEMTMRESPRAAIRLSEWGSMGDWRMMLLYRDRMEEVTADDIVRVAGTYFQPTNRTVGMYYPTKGAERIAIPEAPPAADLLQDYRGREQMAQGEEFDPSPENIESRLQRTVLANGLKLTTLPKETRGETVNVSMTLRMGDEKSLRNMSQIGDLTAEMLLRGTKSRTRQEIQDEIDRLKSRLNLWGAASRVTASLEATRETLPDALRLLADVLQNPSFPSSEFDQAVAEALQDAEEARNDPSRRAYNRFYRHLAPWPRDDVRYVATPEESIEEIESTKLGDLKKFHERFYGGGAAELAIVGDFDDATIDALVAELFGDWKSRADFHRLVSPHQERPAISETIETPDKESAVCVAGLSFPLRDDHPDYPALVIGDFMTGGGFLNSRLATRIRQEEGISYGVRSRFSASALDESAWFSIWAIFAPQNDERLLDAIREEMEKILKDGFREDEITDAKSGWLQSRQVSRGQDRELARRLATNDYLDRTMEWDAGIEKAISSLTPVEILEAMRRHIDLTKVNMIRAGDFANAKEEEPKTATAPAEEHASH